MTWALLLLLGCVADLQGTGWTEQRAHDTDLDRVRVLGVRATPDVPVWGSPFTLDVLAAGPADTPSIVVEGCGWTEASPVRNATCMGLPEMVTTLASQAPAELTREPFESFPPQSCLDGLSADEDTTTADPPTPDCLAPLHLRVTATDTSETDAVVVSLQSADPRYPPPTRLPVGELTLTATQADPVELEVTLPILDDWRPTSNHDVGARWYTSAGVYLGTGRTSGVVEDGVWRSVNTLALDEVDPGAVKVVVVVEVRRGVWDDEAQESPRTEMRWTTAVLEAP